MSKISKDIAQDIAELSAEQRELLELLMREERLDTSCLSITPLGTDRLSLPLSFAQQRLWFLAQFEGAGQAYRIAGGLRLRGELDRQALGRALDRIVARHETLRTTFSQIDGQPILVIGSAENGFQLEEHDLRQAPDAAGALGRLAEREARDPFDLERGPLIRGWLARLAEDDHALLVTMHHIVSDGWSMGILVNELSALYRAYRCGEAAELPELPIQYADYAAWQQRWMSEEILERQAEYWKRTLSGAPVLLELPADRARPAVQDYAGAAVEIRLEEKLSGELRALSRRHGTTLYMTLLAGWAALLGRLSGQDEVVIGTPVANRTRMEIEPLIGFFVNTLALRIDLSGSPSVGELLWRVKARTLEGQQNQEIPFEQVVEIVQPPRSLSHEPIYQAVFAWQNAPEGKLDLPGLKITLMEAPQVTAIFDLRLSLQEAGQKIAGGLEYATALFDRGTVERWLGYWRRLLEGMAAEGDQRIDRLLLLEKTERRQMLEEWNETAAEYPKERLVHELFEEQVEQSPDAIALAHEEQSLSYGELNARANRLARRLRESGVGPDVRAAICLERSVEMVVALLAALKAGGAYVPLDPNYPLERLGYMLEDAGAGVVVTRRELEDHLPAYWGQTVLMDEEWEKISDQSERNLGRAAIGLDARSLAYIIYTSGSTGLPKGVMVEHQGLCNLAFAQIQAFAIGPESRVLQFASFSFDASVFELTMALCRGAVLVLAPRDSTHAGEALIHTVDRYDVSHATLPPAVLAALPQNADLNSIRELVVAGEAVTGELVQCWSPGRRMINAYGPTEVTVWETQHECRGDEPGAPPIGRPIANTQVYILDVNQEPALIGVSGEIYIGGAGVARGYLNRPELTAERFMPDPFGFQPGARLYKTGDLGRWLPEGKIEFLGRNDFQVKIRGFRIEPGEIEARLAERAEVREAVVVAREEGDAGKRLVAYYTGREIGAEELRAHLSSALPEYMVPAAYVHLESLPLTPNGKLDRRALPAPDAEAYARRGYEPPVGETETRLAGIWADLLKLERVGRQDNFFELGGHSLLAVRVASKCGQLDIAISVTDLFTHPTIESLASYVLSRNNGSLKNSVAIPLRTGGTEPPLFLAHEVSGEMLYGPLLVPHLTPGFPVYGLAAPRFSEAPLRTIQAMARRMIGMIRAVQPDGPYRIAGWSFGATLAYEIATQLIGADASVEFLGSLDGGYSGPKINVTDEAQSAIPLDDRDLLLERLKYDEERSLLLERLSEENPSFDDLVRAYQERKLLPAELSVDDMRRLLERVRSHERAARKYIAHPIPIPLHLFATEDTSASNSLRNWELVIPTEQIRLIPVPGTHFSMMGPPHIASLGEALSRALRQARETKAPQPKREYRPLLSIRDVSGAVPFLCVPGAGSSVICFLDLAERLKNIGPVEGLQPRGLDGALVPHATVQAAARAYLQCIEQKYPKGPVRLLGHSFGGWIAFEMAQLLRAAGRAVASLTILDSDPPESDDAVVREYSRTEALMELVDLYEQIAQRSLEIRADQIDALDPDGQLELLAERLAQVGLTPRETRAADLIGTVHTFEAALRTSYRPENVYPYPVWLALANDPKKDQQANEENFESRAAGWRRWAPDLIVWRSRGGHMTMLGKPDVVALADWLLTMLSTTESRITVVPGS